MNKTYRSWFLFCSAVSLWSFGLGVLTITKEAGLAHFFYHIHYLGAITIPVAFLYFVEVYFVKTNKTNKAIPLGLFIAFLQMCLFLGGKLVAPLTPKWKFTFYTNPGEFYWLFMLYFFAYVAYSFYLMISSTQKNDVLEKRKKYFLIIATGVGYMGGSSAFLLVYLNNIPPYGIYFFLLFPIITTYGIVRHRLMDIEVIIKKTLVFAGVFGMVMAIISLVTTVSQSVIGQFVRVPNTVSTAVSMLLAIFLYDPTRRFLIESTDKFLFQKKEDIRVILNRLSKEIITILDLREVGRKVLNTLEDTLRLEASALIVMNDQKQRFEILNSFNLDDDWVFWSQKDPLIQFFSQHFDILNIEEASTREKLPEDLKTQLVSLKASIILPLVIQNSLIGLLILGKKKSDQEFDSQDLDYFPTIASQIAISISNAKLLEEVVSERESKFKAEKEAEMVSYAKTIAHEIKNALVGIANPAMFLSYYQLPDLRIMFEKYIKPNAPEPAQKKYLDICAKIEHQTQTIKNSAEKIRVIAKTAEGTLKNDETSKEELYFRIIWDEAKSDSRVKDVFFSSKLPENFVLVGNLVLLQRVFVNLITNAREAMKADQAEKKIHLECSYKDVEGKKAAWFEFQDNGPGIPKEIQERIFEQGFSTKPKPKKGDINASGYGQGLYVIKKTIEDFHHGKLMLESEAGKGTKFIFWIPAEPEVAAV